MRHGGGVGLMQLQESFPDEPACGGASTSTGEISGTTSTSAETADTGTGQQPADGMYSACDDAADCFGLEFCETGFCTSECTNAAVDCDPSPGGTALPTCFMFGLESLCALDCSGGSTCPTPMQCTPVTTGSVCS
jgi:hypothetical protein